MPDTKFARPFMVMIAGPNGAGKTTLVRHIRSAGIELGDYINPDDIAASLSGSYEERVRSAQKKAEEQRDINIESYVSFSVETVMSHPSKISALAAAQKKGFEVILYFIGTDSPIINLSRVETRVALGGHDVPHEKIVARWHRAMNLVHKAIVCSTKSFIFDNSQFEQSPRLILSIHEAYDIDALCEPPDWVRHFVLDRVRIGTLTKRYIVSSISRQNPGDDGSTT